MADRKQKHLKELEEKKKKLEEYKRNRSSTASNSTPTGGSPSTARVETQEEPKKENLDDFLSTLDKVIPA